MIKGQLPYITGFWAEPFHIQAVAKLHQGYRKEDVDSTIHHLEYSEDPSARELSESIKREHHQNHQKADQ